MLLTSVTRFIGSHTVIQSLNKGYQVVGTLRGMKRPDEIKKGIGQHVSNIDKTLQPILIDLGVERKVNNSKAKKLLNGEPISNKEAVLAFAESMIKQGLV